MQETSSQRIAFDRSPLVRAAVALLAPKKNLSSKAAPLESDPDGEQSFLPVYSELVVGLLVFSSA